jgi:hypothetical protein
VQAVSLASPSDAQLSCHDSIGVLAGTQVARLQRWLNYEPLDVGDTNELTIVKHTNINGVSVLD